MVYVPPVIQDQTSGTWLLLGSALAWAGWAGLGWASGGRWLAPPSPQFSGLAQLSGAVEMA